MRGISVSGWAHDLGGLPQAVAVNNILSTRVAFHAATAFIAGDEMWGVLDANWLGGNLKSAHPGHDYRNSAWYGQRNVCEEGRSLWEAAEMPDFEAPLEDDLVNAGLDLSKEQEARGRRFGPLPGVAPEHARRIGAY
jgi:hypothetical protein